MVLKEQMALLVTTKRGKDEKPKITFKTEHSISSPQRLPEFVGSADYLSLYNEALNNDGEPDLFSAELIEKFLYLVQTVIFIRIQTG